MKHFARTVSVLMAFASSQMIDPSMLVYPTQSGYWDFNDPGQSGDNDPREETQWQVSKSSSKTSTALTTIATGEARKR